MAIPGSRIFIAYAHNPEHYSMLQPDIETESQNNPGCTQRELERKIQQDCDDYEASQKAKIREHMRLVYSFANFLKSKAVILDYDQDLNDLGSDNYLKWCLDKIEASQYVILIVTPSLRDFLRDDVPPEEWLFVGYSLYNLIAGKSKPFLPVFLNRPKDNDLLPVSLEMSSMYEIWQPFTLGYRRRDNLEDLYARLVGQNRYEVPSAPASIVQIPKKRSRVGAGVVQTGQQASVAIQPQHHQFFEVLSRIQVPLTDRQIVLISEKQEFHSRWKVLATRLGVSNAQIEICELDSGVYDSEKCLRMLRCWRVNGGNGSQQYCNSVAFLADQLYNNLRNMNMLGIVHAIVCV